MEKIKIGLLLGKLQLTSKFEDYIVTSDIKLQVQIGKIYIVLQLVFTIALMYFVLSNSFLYLIPMLVILLGDYLIDNVQIPDKYKANSYRR